MEGGDLRGAHLLGVGVEPEVMGSEGSHVVLIATQVEVPHFVSCL